MEVKIRMKLLREKIRGITLERNALLREQREYKRELNELREEKTNEV